jgi:hypothetical protein
MEEAGGHILRQQLEHKCDGTRAHFGSVRIRTPFHSMIVVAAPTK